MLWRTQGRLFVSFTVVLLSLQQGETGEFQNFKVITLMSNLSLVFWGHRSKSPIVVPVFPFFQGFLPPLPQRLTLRQCRRRRNDDPLRTSRNKLGTFQVQVVYRPNSARPTREWRKDRSSFPTETELFFSSWKTESEGQTNPSPQYRDPEPFRQVVYFIPVV